MNSEKKTSCIQYRTCYTYDLPVIEYNYTVPENCTGIDIQMIGGGSSASFDGKEIKGGGSGGEILISIVKPVPNDVINVKLGLGGKFQITKDSELCNSESGQDSEIQLNGKTIAIARGSYNGKGGTCEIVHKDDDNIRIHCTLGKESTSSVRAMTNSNYFYYDKNIDGQWGDGGLGKRYNNGGVYLGTGGHGHLTLWVGTNEYICFECKGLPYVGYPKFTTLELLQSHQQEMHNSVE